MGKEGRDQKLPAIPQMTQAWASGTALPPTCGNASHVRALEMSDFQPGIVSYSTCACIYERK